MNTPPIKTPTIPTEKILEPLDRSGSWISTGGASAGFKAPQQITVMLKGLVFNAVVSVDVWTAESSTIGQSSAILPESDYNIIADISDSNNCRSLTLNAISVGNNCGATLTLAGPSATSIFQEKLRWSLNTLPSFSYNKFTEGTLAEKGHPWAGHSTTNLPKRGAKKSLYGSAGCKVIPSNTVLNLRALVNAFNKLSTQQIERGIQELIDLLDFRDCDPDLEADIDLEPEIEEESTQLI